MLRFYTLQIAAGRSFVSVIRCHLCALEHALKNSNTEQWTTASGDWRNQQPIISWNELKNVSCERQIRNEILWQFLKACKIGKYCTEIKFCASKHGFLHKKKINCKEIKLENRHQTETFHRDTEQDNLERPQNEQVKNAGFRARGISHFG